jgi:hypothetical protein
MFFIFFAQFRLATKIIINNKAPSISGFIIAMIYCRIYNMNGENITKHYNADGKSSSVGCINTKSEQPCTKGVHESESWVENILKQIRLKT